MTLKEVNEFINKYKHLPDVPSQDSISIYGQDIGTLQQLQQMKIEELTLYSIQQDNKITEQADIIKTQQAQLMEQSERIKKIELFLYKSK